MNVLVLLVGSNPIPVYVTASYLLNEGRNAQECGEVPVPDKIVFVFTSGVHSTEKFKNSIVDKLNLKSGQFVSVDLGDKSRKYEYIYERLRKKLEELFEGIDKSHSTIHLGYTGGTKVMVLSSSQVVSSFCNERSLRCLFSSVDPKERCLAVVDGKKHTEIFYPPVSLNGNLLNYFQSLTLPDIFELHDLGIKDSKKDVPPLFKLYDHEGNWYSIMGSEEFQGKLEQFEKEFHSNQTASKEEKQVHLQELLANNNLLPDGEISSNKKYKNYYDLAKGDWIELAVFDALSEISASSSNRDIHDVQRNVIKASEHDFEIDVIALRGYETIIFTCTSDYGPKMCKQKAFEGYMRAQQIGGEHARCILVCLAGETAKAQVREDMEQFDAAQNFAVIGRADFANKAALKDALLNIL